MKNSRFRHAFREAVSFVAGVLIGLSIVVVVFAMIVASPSDSQTLWIFGGMILLAFGITLQVVVMTEPGRRRTAHPELGMSPIGFLPLFHER